MAESPGVYVYEKDATFNINSIESSASSFIGLFNWGPINQLIKITTNESELLEKLGRPDNSTTLYFHSASNFLKYAVPLYIVRAADENEARNAVPVGDAPVFIPNDAAYESSVSVLDDIPFIARYAGALGNNLDISCASAAGYSTWDYADEFQYAPEGDEFNLVVIDRTGAITGNAGTVLERFELLTKTEGSKKPDGSSAYVSKVLYDQSRWILAGDVEVIDFTDTGSYGVFNVTLQGGVDGNTDVDNVDWLTAAEVLRNTETLDIISNFIAGTPSMFVGNIIDTMESRQDAVAFVAPQLSDVLNNVDPVAAVKNFFNVTINKNHSYAFFVDNWKMVYDRYNDKSIWIPTSSDAAGLNSRVFVEAEPWMPSAGLNRGQLRNVIKLAWSANKAQRDLLYRDSINSIITAANGEGTVLWGDKTALKRPSAFSRLNVRNLFIVLKKSIARAARYQLFELNDEITRTIFRSSVNRYLESVQGRRGLYRYLVKCDETNNTPQVINSNEFVADIFLDPTRSINFIKLSFIAVDAGVEFSEIEGV